MSLKTLRIVILVFFVGLLAFSTVGLLRLKFAFSFESFLPPDDADLAFHEEFNAQFSKAESAVNIGFVRAEGVFDTEFLAKVSKFGKAARKLPLVTNTYSLLSMKDVLYSPLFPVTIPVLKWKNAEDLAISKAEIMQDPRWRNNFVSADGKMLMMQIGVSNQRENDEEAEFVKALFELGDSFDFEEWHAVGFPVAHHELLTLQQEQFGTYVALATIVMFLCMVVLFRRFWGIFISFLSVFSGMIIFFGVLGWIGQALDLLATLFPILLVIVGTSDVVHLMTKYVDEMRRGNDKRTALKKTLKEIGMATFMTSFTTGIGFLSLFSSKMPPVRNFGLLSAIGVMLAFVTVILLTTALVSWFGPDQLMRKKSQQNKLDHWLQKINRFTFLRPKTITISTLLLIGLSIFWSSKISTNLTAQRDLPRNSRILSSFQAVDTTLNGIDAISIAMIAEGKHTFHELDLQNAIENLENEVRKNPLVGQVHTLNTFYKLANRYFHNNDPVYYKLAENESQQQKLKTVIEKHLKEPLNALLSGDGKTAKLFINLPDIGSGKIRAFNDKLDAWIAQNIDSTKIKFKHTGHRYILDKNQEMLAASLMYSLGFAFLIVAICMALLFKNLKMVLISLIPNIVPLLVTAGLIGILGFQLDPKVAIVFTVAFGIAVDDSIHFLARYRLERAAGKNIDEAIEATFKETGKAMLFTTIILFLGFGTLVFSNFPPTYTIGLLLSITLLVALVADFLLLPLLLRWGSRKNWKNEPKNDALSID